MKSNIKVISNRIENILLQLDPVVEKQMEHEKEVYLKAVSYTHLLDMPARKN